MQNYKTNLIPNSNTPPPIPPIRILPSAFCLLTSLLRVRAGMGESRRGQDFVTQSFNGLSGSTRRAASPGC